ncbi:MAG: hypothetical protein JJE46_00965 [Acidimicrobiia bacterium]|nr:hypothetical protein [Acidimicrobiia bacterium]
MAESVSLVTSDGLTLEAELSVAPAETVRLVLCHPHPLHGGDMRSLVISELFRNLPELGATCLRFNFRGVGLSTGSHDRGDAERNDAVAALSYLVADTTVPVFIAGWSFGADVALSVQDPRHAGWIAIAAPLASSRDLDATATDPRPKLLLLAENDEVRPATEVATSVASWTETTVAVIPGASHFFVGRTGLLVEQTTAWLGSRTGEQTG